MRRRLHDSVGHPHRDHRFQRRALVQNTLDIKAREIKLKAKKARLESSKEIYDSIPTFAPRASTLVQVKDEEKGQYTIIDKPFFDSLPQWRWADVLTLGLTMAEGLSIAAALQKMDDVQNNIHEV